MQKLWVDAFAAGGEREALGDLVASLVGRVRPNFQSLLALVRRGNSPAILTTAAAGEYAHATAKQLGFHHVLASSRVTDENCFDNSGNEKRRRTLEYLQRRNWHERKRIFFTDHLADLPLMCDCDVILWFGEKADLDKVKRAAPEARIMACREFSDQQVMSLVSREFEEDRPVARSQSYENA